MLFSVGLWGFTLSTRGALRYLAGIGGPILMIALWSLFGAPGAVVELHGGVRLAFQIVWFGLGALALWAAGRTNWAVVFAVVWIISTILVNVWHQHA